jgi:hypothetical protein
LPSITILLFYENDDDDDDDDDDLFALDCYNSILVALAPKSNLLPKIICSAVGSCSSNMGGKSRFKKRDCGRIKVFKFSS